MGLFGMLFSFQALAFALAGFAALFFSMGLHGGLFALALAVVCLVLAYFCAIIGLPYLVNALRPGPAIIIDLAGLEDRRLKLHLQWDEISNAQLRYSRMGVGALALRTHDGPSKRTSRFQAGAFSRRGDQIVIPVQFLRPSSDLVALLMVTLVERAGGTVEGKPFWAQ